MDFNVFIVVPSQTISRSIIEAPSYSHRMPKLNSLRTYSFYYFFSLTIDFVKFIRLNLTDGSLTGLVSFLSLGVCYRVWNTGRINSWFRDDVSLLFSTTLLVNFFPRNQKVSHLTKLSSLYFLWLVLH